MSEIVRLMPRRHEAGMAALAAGGWFIIGVAVPLLAIAAVILATGAR